MQYDDIRGALPWKLKSYVFGRYCADSSFTNGAHIFMEEIPTRVGTIAATIADKHASRDEAQRCRLLDRAMGFAGTPTVELQFDIYLSLASMLTGPLDFGEQTTAKRMPHDVRHSEYWYLDYERPSVLCVK